MKKQQLFFHHDNIVSLDHGDPFYLKKFSHQICGKHLFFSIPKKIIEEINKINPEFVSRNNESFDGGDGFTDLVRITSIANLDLLIEEHQQLVGNEFLRKVAEGHLLFNGDKYGVQRVVVDRVGNDEDSKLIITFFKTDYFTHQVFRSIYKQLKSEGHAIASIDSTIGVSRYFPFFTSFGINALVVLEKEGFEEVVLAERSGKITKDNQNIWHVTVNEGLSMTDIEDQTISLSRCLNRGLREELGLKETHYEKINNKYFYDLFINLDDLEMGLTAVVFTEFEFNTIKTLYRSAKDAELETTGLISVKATKGDLYRFLKTNKTTKACAYLLHMFVARKTDFF